MKAAAARVDRRVEGARLLEPIVRARGAAEVARKARSSQVSVRLWVNGQRRPGGDARQALAHHYDIPIESWIKAPEIPPAAETGVRPKLVEAPKIDVGLPAKELVRMQLQGIRNRIAAAEAGDANPSTIATLENAYTAAVRLYAKLAGELEITEATIMRSSAWAKLMKRLREVLELHPDAAKAIEAAFEEYGGAA